MMEGNSQMSLFLKRGNAPLNSTTKNTSLEDDSIAVLKTELRLLLGEATTETHTHCDVGTKTHPIVMSNWMTSLSYDCHFFRICPRKILR